MTERNALLPTGISGLNIVLGGGVSQPAFMLIIGSPGAGKTVLASQVVFTAARQGQQTAIFTSYSEGNDSYIAHMRGFSFFDSALIGNLVQLYSLQSQFSSEDVSPAATIMSTIRSIGARLVFIDGFQGIAPLISEKHNLRAVLSALAVQTRYFNVTLIITVTGDARDKELYSILTIADVALGLNYQTVGRRHQHLLEAIKQRGRPQLPGLHSYRISPQGIDVYPRIEAYDKPKRPAEENTRLAFGLPELDALLRGGLNSTTATLLAGAPGVGKTLLGMVWALANARPDAISLFISFSEQPERLEQKVAAFGLDLAKAQQEGSVIVLRFPASDIDPDRIATELLNEFLNKPIRRFVFDDSAVFIQELGERTISFMSALNDMLYSINITSMYLYEIPPFDGLRVNLANTPLGVLGDNVIVIQQYEIAGELRRLLAVLRMRLSFFDSTVRELMMDERGIRVLEPKQSTDGVLSTGAQMGGGVAPTAEAKHGL